MVKIDDIATMYMLDVLGMSAPWLEDKTESMRCQNEVNISHDR